MTDQDVSEVLDPLSEAHDLIGAASMACASLGPTDARCLLTVLQAAQTAVSDGMRWLQKKHQQDTASSSGRRA